MRVRSLVVTASIASGVIVTTMFAESLSSTSAQNLYMQTNETRNAIIHYSRSANGRIAEVERIPTGGAGSGEFKPISDQESAPNAFEGAGCTRSAPTTCG